MLKMFLVANDENLQVPELHITKEMYSDYKMFMNGLMAEVYFLFFQKRLPRVIPEMKDLLQPPMEKGVGDWFLFKQGTIIRVYGFSQAPYELPAFLTPRIFTMEFVRQKLTVECEHFLDDKKASGINFPWTVGSIMVKSRASLSSLQQIMKDMGFPSKAAVNYDPHHILSERRKTTNRKGYEHFELAGMAETENLLEYIEQGQMGIDPPETSQTLAYLFEEGSSSAPRSSSKDTAVKFILPLVAILEKSNHQEISSPMDVDSDHERASKRQKIQEVDQQVAKIQEENPKKKQVKFRMPHFEVKEHVFGKPPKGHAALSMSRGELLEGYEENLDNITAETKLYEEVRKISKKSVALVASRNLSHNTLNLALATKNKATELKVNLEDIPDPDIINLHKETSEVIYNKLLKGALELSKVQ